MIPIRDLFETHLTVGNLERSVKFYRDVLGLPLAQTFPERRVAFFWIGAPGKSMLGLWETGTGPQQMKLHLAFDVSVDGVLASLEALRQAGIPPLDLAGAPTDEPVVLAWMPAVAIYFQDPDGNLLEFLSMLPQPQRPDLGVIPWSSWIVTCGVPE
jgi:lactoylglutathione lyase